LRVCRRADHEGDAPATGGESVKRPSGTEKETIPDWLELFKKKVRVMNGKE